MAAKGNSSILGLVTLAFAGLMGLITLSSAMYSVDESEQVILLQFGAPVGEAIDEPGLHFKKPFIQEVRRFDKRILEWDGYRNEIPTKGREFIFVDTTARWHIVNPRLFLESVRDEDGARSRLDDILDSAVRDEISSLELVEIVRSTSWKVPPEALREQSAGGDEDAESLAKPIHVGREGLISRILERAKRDTLSIGIELVDVRIKRLQYTDSVRRKVYDRMISERQRIAAQFRSEGEGRSAEIKGNTEKMLQAIRSEAFRQAEIIRGQADAEASRVYADSFSASPSFYAFLRTLESYEYTIGPSTTLFLPIDSDYARLLTKVGTADREIDTKDIKERLTRVLKIEAPVAPIEELQMDDTSEPPATE